MRRGCIAVGKIQCDGCHGLINYGERYLAIEEEGEKQHLCVACCLRLGYASYKTEDGKETITFFPKEEV
jgi:hypothetical protein